MAKFNVVQKMKRERSQERRRAVHGDPGSGKLKQRTNPTSLSGKRKQKLLRKWRRDQKEAVKKGLVTMADVEMVSAEENSGGGKEKGSVKFHMKKKSSKLKIKLKGKGGKKGKDGEGNSKPKVDSMVE